MDIDIEQGGTVGCKSRDLTWTQNICYRKRTLQMDKNS